MWHYVEGIRNWNPIWPHHGIRILPGPSSLWLDATRPAPARPAVPRLRHARHARAHRADRPRPHVVRAHAEDHREGVRALGLRAEPRHHRQEHPATIRSRCCPGAPGPVEAFKRHGEDFVVERDLGALVRGMNAITDEPLLDPERVEARDRRPRPGAGQPVREGPAGRRHPRRAPLPAGPHPAHRHAAPDPRPGGRPAHRGAPEHPHPQVARRPAHRPRRARAAPPTASRCPGSTPPARSRASAAAGCTAIARSRARSSAAASSRGAPPGVRWPPPWDHPRHERDHAGSRPPAPPDAGGAPDPRVRGGDLPRLRPGVHAREARARPSRRASCGTRWPRGYMGVNVPEEYDGGGLGMSALSVVGEELAAAGCTLLLIVVSPAIVGSLLAKHGTTEQKERWLRGHRRGHDEDRVRDHRGRRGHELAQPVDLAEARRQPLHPQRPEDIHLRRGGRGGGARRRAHRACPTAQLGLPTLVIVDVDAPGFTRQDIPMPSAAPTSSGRCSSTTSRSRRSG